MSNYKLETFDTTASPPKPKLRDSNAISIDFLDVLSSSVAVPVHFSTASNKLSDLIAGIDAALAGAAGTSFNETSFNIYKNGTPSDTLMFVLTALTAARTITMPDSNVDLGLVATAIQQNGSVSFTANQPMASHKLTGLSAGSTAGDSVRYEQAILISGANAFAANQPMGGFKLTGLAAGTGAGDSVRYEQAILISGVNAFTANQSFGSFKATNLADPTLAQDAATKAYVDSLLDGRNWKQHCRAASTANVNISSAPASIDGVTLASLDRVLLKDQTTGSENGIYVFNGAGSALTRATDADTGPELEGAAVFVDEGTVSHDYQFAQTADAITLGTTALVWVVTSANSFSGHDMISIIGGQISVDLATNAGLVSTNPGNAAGQLQVNDDNSTLERNTNVLRVKDGGITPAKLSAGVAGAGLNNTGTSLDVSTDGVSTQIVSDQVVVKFDETLTNAEGSAAFAARDVGYISAAGNVLKAIATGSYNLGTKFVMASASVIAGASGLYYSRRGALIGGFSSLTVGQPVYLSRTTSGVVQSLSGFVAGDQVVQIGNARSATQIEFDPSYVTEF